MNIRDLTNYMLPQRLSVAAAALFLSLTATQAQNYPATVLADKPSAYYRFEETTNSGYPGSAFDSTTNGYDATIYYTGEYTSPLLGLPGIDTNSYEFQIYNGTESDYGYVDVPNGAGLTPSDNVFSVELWVQPQSQPGNGGWQVPFEVCAFPNGWNFYVSGLQDGNGSTSFFYLDMRPAIFQGFGNVPITFFDWYHLVLSCDGANAVTYINGVAQATNSLSGFAPATGVDGHVGSGQGATWQPFIGGIDEVAIYTNALTAAQVATHYSVGTNSFFVVTNPAVVATEPLSLTNYSGTVATFSALGTGTAPVFYQWYSNGVALAGATSTSISVAAQYPADNGADFTVVVSNRFGSQTSVVASLTVLTQLNIVAVPASITRNVGSYAAFHVTANGALPISYQWSASVNGGNTFTNISGATNATLWLTNVTQAMDQNQYSVLVVGPFETNSEDATLSVQARQDPPVPLSGYGAIVAADKPVAYWRLDETGGSLAEDAVGSFDGTYTPNSGSISYGVPTGIPSSADPAVTLANGATIQVPFAPELNPDTAWSVETWINPASLGANGGDYRIVLSSEYQLYPNPYNGWYLYQQPSGSLAFVPQPGNGFIVAGAMVPGDWYHIVITDDLTNFTMYINGAAATGFPVSGDAFVPDGDGINLDGTAGLGGTDGGNFVIGQRTDGQFNTFEGTVDDTAVYQYALSAQQIASHYAVAPIFKIAKASATTVSLTWTAGVLQETSSLNGVYTNVVGATSPFTTTVSGSASFFRVHVP